MTYAGIPGNELVRFALIFIIAGYVLVWSGNTVVVVMSGACDGIPAGEFGGLDIGSLDLGAPVADGDDPRSKYGSCPFNPDDKDWRLALALALVLVEIVIIVWNLRLFMRLRSIGMRGGRLGP
ncbi:MAG: hypothetical protein MPK62_01970 [Alphaproteobacteria bacterium]|nr:hypothetical protein [Alphaproteobacteria bacterium]MDA8029900.1 hypothetical protein [Alphaproteobacteria bacterium]